MQLRLKQHITHTSDATTFVFEPLEPLQWIAGQSIKIEVPGAYGPLEHRFTISAAPYERDIAITTRNSGSAFKKSLFSLKPGDILNAFSVVGDFTWQETALPIILVAAGIGITPFYAMLKQRLHDGHDISATLLYGSPTSDILFKTDIDSWQQSQPKFATHYFTGERLTAEHIAQIANPDEGLVYLSGPSAMVDQLGKELIAYYAVDPRNLRRDWFTGKLSAEG